MDAVADAHAPQRAVLEVAPVQHPRGLRLQEAESALGGGNQLQQDCQRLRGQPNHPTLSGELLQSLGLLGEDRGTRQDATRR